jgi:hypothetical protein
MEKVREKRDGGKKKLSIQFSDTTPTHSCCGIKFFLPVLASQEDFIVIFHHFHSLFLGFFKHKRGPDNENGRFSPPKRRRISKNWRKSLKIPTNFLFYSLNFELRSAFDVPPMFLSRFNFGKQPKEL